MMIPMHLVLIQDENFKKCIKLYAGDQDNLLTAFSKAFQKLEELGTSKNLVATKQT